MKPSATEWVWRELSALYAARQLGICDPTSFIEKQIDLLNRAKEMEKQQILEAWDDGWLECTTSDQSIIDAEEYYNLNYENKKYDK